MLYPYMTLPDETEIVHSEIINKDDKEQVKIYIERPVDGGFDSATCWLPDYKWEEIKGFSQKDIDYFSAKGIIIILGLDCSYALRVSSKVGSLPI